MYKLNIIISDQRFGGQVAQTFFNEDRVRVNQLFEVKLKRFSLYMSTFLQLDYKFKMLLSSQVRLAYLLTTMFPKISVTISQDQSTRASTLVNVLREKVFYRRHLHDLVTCFHGNTNSFNFQRERIFLKNTFFIHSTLLSDFFYSVLMRKQRERVCGIYCKGNTYPS